MATGIGAYPNIDTTDPTNYPQGNLKDDPAGLTGTPVNVLTNADIHQTFYRALERTELTANGLPDNVSNGYQYSSALGLENWVSFSLPAFTAVGGGSMTGGTVVYNRYMRSGKTLHYQAKITGVTVSGTVISAYVNLTGALGTTQLAANAVGGIRQLCGFVNITDILVAKFENPSNPGFNIQKLGANFSAGSTDLEISIVAELL